VTTKGQVTILARIRERLHIALHNNVDFLISGNTPLYWSNRRRLKNQAESLPPFAES
jgi:bifunctional DNA-binding transcriptional regulator/antitoxin component of YhaV-PrlF toxin-antitoxin module